MGLPDIGCVTLSPVADPPRTDNVWLAIHRALLATASEEWLNKPYEPQPRYNPCHVMGPPHVLTAERVAALATEIMRREALRMQRQDEVDGWSMRVPEPKRFMVDKIVRIVAVDPLGRIHDVAALAGL